MIKDVKYPTTTRAYAKPRAQYILTSIVKVTMKILLGILIWMIFAAAFILL